MSMYEPITTEEMRSKIRRKLGEPVVRVELTDDQIDVIAGRREQLAGKIQEVYGKAMDEVEKELTECQNMQKESSCCSKETKSH